MKTIMMGFLLMGLLIFGSNGIKPEGSENKQQASFAEVTKIPMMSEDDLHCVVRDPDTGKKVAECWFCNCAELLETYLKNRQDSAEE